MKRSTTTDVQRLLVIRLSALGDVIHTIPAVVALKRALPDTEIAWVVEKPYAELVERVAGVRAIPVSMKRWGRELVASRSDIARTIRALRIHARAETTVDFQGLVKSASLGVLAGGRRRFGFDAASIREKPALAFLNERIEVDPRGHVIEWNLELARGIAHVDRGGPVDFLPFVAEEAAHLTPLRDRVILLPGAGKVNKLWPIERFRELASRIGSPALAVWGPGEEQLARGAGCDVAPPTTLRELAFVLATARMVVGADTGPLHLAAALHTPVVGLFGPTNPRRNGPWGQPDHSISRFDGDRRMESIGVDEVMGMMETVRR